MFKPSTGTILRGANKLKSSSVAIYAEPTIIRQMRGEGWELRLESLRQRTGGEPILRWVANIATKKVALDTCECYVSLPRFGSYVNMDVLQLVDLCREDGNRLLDYIKHKHKRDGVRPLP